MELWRADALLSPETSWCWAQEGEARAWLRQLREGRLGCRKKGASYIGCFLGALVLCWLHQAGQKEPLTILQASCALRKVTHHWKPAKTSPTLRDLGTLSSSPSALCSPPFCSLAWTSSFSPWGFRLTSLCGHLFSWLRSLQILAPQWNWTPQLDHCLLQPPHVGWWGSSRKGGDIEPATEAEDLSRWDGEWWLLAGLSRENWPQHGDHLGEGKIRS